MNRAQSVLEALELGFPFDQLLDRECDLDWWKKGERNHPRGLKLPRKAAGNENEEDTPGTGNIVIAGPPGSGKSTLALQIAAACAARNGNKSSAAYISLESSVAELIAKAEPFGWHDWCRKLESPCAANEFAEPDDLAEWLRMVLVSPPNKEKAELGVCQARRVLLCSLSPRPLVAGESHDDLFWRRYQQMERLLIAAERLSDRDGEDDWRSRSGIELDMVNRLVLPVVVIDSLNTFGSRMLNREEVFRVFSLFRKHYRIGVFVVESRQDTPFDSTMADVVISLTNEDDRGYFIRHVEIEKSRYSHQIYGRHPYKIDKRREHRHTPIIPGKDDELEKGLPPRSGVVVYPSLHYIKGRTEQENKERARNPEDREEPWLGDWFGIKAFGRILPRNLRPHAMVTIEGPRGTFKTSFALNFLAAGLRRGENVLLIRLGEGPLLHPSGSPKDNPRLCVDIVTAREKPFHWEDWVQNDSGDRGNWSSLASEAKGKVTAWTRRTSNEQIKGALRAAEPTLYELSLKGGALLPEELVDITREILLRQRNGQKITRVVLDDVSRIGTSYPILQKSSTAGDLFLSLFAHIIHNEGIDLVMTGTTGGPAPADEIVQQACTLADTVVSCRFCEIFGARHVTVTGEGLVAGKQTEEQASESVPAVVRIDKAKGDYPVFRVEAEYLEGLVGFESGRIHRPGVGVILFQENKLIHARYNSEIEIMLQAGMASWVDHHHTHRYTEATPVQVTVLPFQSGDSEAIHDSLRVLKPGAPLDKTVLCTVDEFGRPVVRDYSESGESEEDWFVPVKLKDAKADDFIFSDSKAGPSRSGDQQALWPYYSNVMLLAFRRDLPKAVVRAKLNELLPSLNRNGCPIRPASWKKVFQAAQLIFENIGPGGSVRKPSHGCPPPDVSRMFWADLSAGETLSCLLLDAIAAAVKPDQSEHVADPASFWEEAFQLLSKWDKHRRFGRELKAVCDLLENAAPIHEQSEAVLPKDAAVYVCWYSQLRELIHRCPQLSDVIDVCPLPGRGFKGDWFIGVIKGSVSVSLGRSMIERLCSVKEDYERFAIGVGLPARGKFYEEPRSFFCWPRGRHVRLSRLRSRIHEHAWSRHDIMGYRDFRCALFTVARQLTLLTGPPFPDNKSKPHTIKQIVSRLSKQIDLLSGKDLHPGV